MNAFWHGFKLAEEKKKSPLRYALPALAGAVGVGLGARAYSKSQMHRRGATGDGVWARIHGAFSGFADATPTSVRSSAQTYGLNKDIKRELSTFDHLKRTWHDGVGQDMGPSETKKPFYDNSPPLLNKLRSGEWERVIRRHSPRDVVTDMHGRSIPATTKARFNKKPSAKLREEFDNSTAEVFSELAKLKERGEL